MLMIRVLCLYLFILLLQVEWSVIASQAPTAIPTGLIENSDWYTVTVTTSSDMYLSTVWYSSLNAIMVGVSSSDNNGYVHRTADGGATWIRTVFFRVLLFDVTQTEYQGATYFFTSADRGRVYRIAESSLTAGTCDSTTPVSSSCWTLIASFGSAYYLNGITVGPNGVGVVVGVNGDGTAHSQVALTIANAITVTSSATAVWSDNLPTSLSTVCGGTACPQFNGASTVDGVNIIIVGSGGSVYYSTDSGTSWTAGTSGTTADIYCIAHGNVSVAMALGASNYVSKTIDNGVSYETLSVFPSGTSTSLPAFTFDIPHPIHMVSEGIAYAASYDGYLFKTNDGGYSWSEDLNIVPSNLYTLGM